MVNATRLLATMLFAAALVAEDKTPSLSMEDRNKALELVNEVLKAKLGKAELIEDAKRREKIADERIVSANSSLTKFMRGLASKMGYPEECFLDASLTKFVRALDGKVLAPCEVTTPKATQ